MRILFYFCAGPLPLQHAIFRIDQMVESTIGRLEALACSWNNNLHNNSVAASPTLD